MERKRKEKERKKKKKEIALTRPNIYYNSVINQTERNHCRHESSLHLKDKLASSYADFDLLH